MRSAVDIINDLEALLVKNDDEGFKTYIGNLTISELDTLKRFTTLLYAAAATEIEGRESL